MKAKYTNSAHLNKASSVLQALRPNITVDDKRAAAKRFEYSDATINTYLNGDARDLGTAEKLIVFFKECIARREQMFNQVLNPADFE